MNDGEQPCQQIIFDKLDASFKLEASISVV